MFENSFKNKKRKEIKKGSPRMNSENYAERLVSLNNFKTFPKPAADFKKVSRLTTFQGETQKNYAIKTKFS